MGALFDADEIDLRKLDQLIKALKKSPRLKVGILGDSRNATVGAVHEFGAPGRNIPQRSFLRVPIADHLEDAMTESGIFDNPDTLNTVLKEGTMHKWVEKVGILSMGVIDDAFETSGDGKWPEWKDPNYHNEGGALLVDTGQLRRSITYEVTDG